MKGSSTIIIAREDFSIPGAEPNETDQAGKADDNEQRLFELLRQHRPDVVVLDLSTTSGKGLEAIMKLRESSRVPILVVHRVADPIEADYRIAGAAACMTAPVDIIELNRIIQRIISVTGTARSAPTRPVDVFKFANIAFRPAQNLLRGPSAAVAKLTTSENDVLVHLVSRARVVCSRTGIAEILYSRHRPNSDRAIDMIINRLRKKLSAVAGEHGEMLIKTEFRRGYVMVADVAEAAVDEFDAAHIRRVA